MFVPSLTPFSLNYVNQTTSEPTAEYDIDDVRSIDYDSYRLVRDAVVAARDEASKEEGFKPKVQSEDLDITYWVFEGETSEGVFASRDSIQAMKDAFDLFLEDQDYDLYCKLTYETTNSPATNDTNTTMEETSSCDLPITPLVAYYASGSPGMA